MAFGALPSDPLGWLISHPQLILVLGGGAIWFFRQLASFAARAGTRTAEAGGSGATEEAERLRRVQEEVRRKIAERRSRPVAPPLVAPRPVAQPLGWPLRREMDPRPEPADDEPVPLAPVPLTPPPPPRRLATPEAVAREAKAFAAATLAAPAPVVGSTIAAELREPGNARRAILWREILGPPVGLR